MERPSIKRPAGLNKLHLLDEHLIGIGYVAVRAGQLDSHIERIVEQSVAGTVKTIRKRINGLSVPQKIDLIGEWLEKDIPSKATEIKEFTSKLHAARAERDDVVHRSWERTDNDDLKKLVDRRPLETPKVKRQVTAQYLLDLGERILQLGMDLPDWRDAAFQAVLKTTSGLSLITTLPPLPGIAPQQVQLPNCSAMTQAYFLAVQAARQAGSRPLEP